MDWKWTSMLEYHHQERCIHCYQKHPCSFDAVYHEPFPVQKRRKMKQRMSNRYKKRGRIPDENYCQCHSLHCERAREGK